MITLLLIQKIASLFLIMGVGFALVRTKLLKDVDSQVLTTITVYAITPCAIISAFQVELTPDVIAGFCLALVAAIIIQVFQILLTKIVQKPLKLTPVERASCIYSNCGNLIIPLVGFCLGDEWVIYSLAYMSVQTVFIWTHCKSIIQEQSGFDIKRILLNINLIAIVVGFIMFILNIRLIGPLETFVYDVGQWIGPACMLVAGMVVGGMRIRDMFANKRLWLVCFIRLMAIPAILCLVLKFCGAAALVANGDSILFITLLGAITPTASVIVQMAVLYDKNPPYASSINVISTLLCIITMPIWVYLYFL